MKILVVEDNVELANWLSRNFRKEGYTVDCLEQGEHADYALKSASYDLVILDLLLPGLGGLEILKRLRARGNRTPVLLLTANNTLQSRVNGLDQGADDYLSKPFDIEELEARIRVLLRRASGNAAASIVCGALSYDANSREFVLGGESLSLTPRERAVLELLIRKSGTTISKQVLAQSLFALDESFSTDAIEIYVHRVRKKLEHSNVRILTLRGLGYMLQADQHG